MGEQTDYHNRRRYDKWERDLVEVKQSVVALQTKQVMIEKLIWAILFGIMGLFIKSLLPIT